MTGVPGFGVLLTRLAAHRRLSVAEISSLSSVREGELRSVFDGAVPGPSLLRQLAPVFRLHAEDLFVIAEVALPLAMTPLDPRAGIWAAHLAGHAVQLPPQERGQLRRLATSMVQQDRTQPFPEPRSHLQYPSGPGGLLMRLLGNRNLGWVAGAQTFLHLTGRYWSAATYGQIGHGRKELTPELLADYATVLGIRADDLAVLTGIDLSDSTPPPAQVSVDVAGLIWDVRRLTHDQVRQLCNTGKTAASR